jgi:hypothetical protein
MWKGLVYTTARDSGQLSRPDVQSIVGEGKAASPKPEPVQEERRMSVFQEVEDQASILGVNAKRRSLLGN